MAGRLTRAGRRYHGRSRGRLSATAVVLLLAALPVGWSGSQATAAVAAPQAARLAPPGELVDFEADLVMPGFDEVAAAAAAISDPASPAYRQYLSAAGVRRSVRPARCADLRGRRLADRARLPGGQPAGEPQLPRPASHGRPAPGDIRSGPRRPDRRHGDRVPPAARDAGGAARAASVRHEDRRPRHLAGVTAQATLRAGQRTPPGGPGQGLRDRRPARPGLDGSGQSMAVVSFDTFDPRDIAAFRQGDRDQRPGRPVASGWPAHQRRRATARTRSRSTWRRSGRSRRRPRSTTTRRPRAPTGATSSTGSSRTARSRSCRSAGAAASRSPSRGRRSRRRGPGQCRDGPA